MIDLENKIEKLGGFQMEGLLRRPGHLAFVARLRNLGNEGNESYLENARINDMVSLYKSWFRKLPGALVDDDLTRQLLESDEFLSNAESMPVVHRNVLKHLIGFLRYAATFNAGTLTNTPHQFIKWNLIEQG
jgi:hypothetical protein